MTTPATFVFGATGTHDACEQRRGHLAWCMRRQGAWTVRELVVLTHLYDEWAPGYRTDRCLGDLRALERDRLVERIPRLDGRPTTWTLAR